MKSETGTEKMVGCLILLALFPVAAFARGYALSWLWAWFVVPLGIMPISLVWALGISLIMYVLTDHSTSSEYSGKEMSEIVGIFFSNALIQPVLVLAMGWAYHYFM